MGSPWRRWPIYGSDGRRESRCRKVCVRALGVRISRSGEVPGAPGWGLYVAVPSDSIHHMN